MLSTHENAGAAGQYAEIERLAGDFAKQWRLLHSQARLMQEAIAAQEARWGRCLRETAALVRTARAALAAAIEANPELFERPRTVVFSGVKIGFKKGSGKLEIEDEEATIARIEKAFGPAASAYLNATVKLNKAALAELDAKSLAALGVTLEGTTDVVVISPEKSTTDKLVKTYLAEPAKA